MLLPRVRHDPRPPRADGRDRAERRDLQRRLDGARLDPRVGRSGAGPVLEATGSESTLDFLSYDEVYGRGIDDMLHRIPAIEKVRGAIDWQPTRNLDDILEDVIEHARGDSLAVAEPAAGS